MEEPRVRWEEDLWRELRGDEDEARLEGGGTASSGRSEGERRSAWARRHSCGLWELGSAGSEGALGGSVTTEAGGQGRTSWRRAVQCRGGEVGACACARACANACVWSMWVRARAGARADERVYALIRVRMT